MLRNAREVELCRKEIMGLSALKRGIARMSKSFAVDATELESQLDDRMQLLSDQMEQYRSLQYKVGKNSPSADPLRLVADLPMALIEARISLGWTQSDLARYSQMTRQQIANHEKTLYSKISLSKAIAIAQLLDERSKPSPDLSAKEG